MEHLNGTEWVALVVLSLIWAVLGYFLSENDRRRLGRTPWGLPSALWAFFWFLSLLVGLVLYLIAHSAGLRRARQAPPGVAIPFAGAVPRAGRSVAEQFPSYPQPANSPAPPSASGDAQLPLLAPSPEVIPAVGPPAEGQAPPGDVQGWPYSPPAWHPDPSGRFHYRWWDGAQWTSQVSTDGHHLIDTNPDQRTGPY